MLNSSQDKVIVSTKDREILKYHDGQTDMTLLQKYVYKKQA